MSVAYDTTTNISGVVVTSLITNAFTITSSANRAGILGLAMGSTFGSVFTGSIGGVTGAAIAGTDISASRRVLMFGVTAPPSGSQTARMDWTTGVTAVLGVV